MDDIKKLGNLSILQGQLGIKQGKGAPTPASGNEKGFSDVLKDSIKEVNNLQSEANKAIVDLAKGEVKDVHQTMTALKKADLSLKLMMQVRSKILEAYQEVMRQQG